MRGDVSPAAHRSRRPAIEARIRLRPLPTSAGDARRFVRSTLTSWHCDTLTDTATLLASELVTNAVLHARSDVEVVVVRTRGGVRVEVADTSADVPMLRQHDQDAMTGRGLSLVNSLARAWGIDRSPTGKAVWFELA